jgi:hypothetical protein
MRVINEVLERILSRERRKVTIVTNDNFDGYELQSNKQLAIRYGFPLNMEVATIGSLEKVTFRRVSSIELPKCLVTELMLQGGLFGYVMSKIKRTKLSYVDTDYCERILMGNKLSFFVSEGFDYMYEFVYKGLYRIYVYSNLTKEEVKEVLGDDYS